MCHRKLKGCLLKYQSFVIQPVSNILGVIMITCQKVTLYHKYKGLSLWVLCLRLFSTPVTDHVVIFVMIMQSLFVPCVLIFFSLIF